MPDGLVVYRFGAFESDPESRRLSSRAQSRDVTLSVPQAAILVFGTDTIYIETVPFHGFRFVVPVERAVRDVTAGSVDARLEPFLRLVQAGRTLQLLSTD